MDQELYLKLFTITCLSLALLGVTISSISSNIYANYVTVLKWGSVGSGNGEFIFPEDIAVDSSGNVFVTDDSNQHIQMFQLANPCPSGTTQVVSGVCFSKVWGSLGTGNGQFIGSYSAAVDSSGNVFVTDRDNHRIQMFQLANPCPSGTTQVVPGVCFSKVWGSYGSGNGEFIYPFGVAVDSSGNVFVADTGNQRIQMFQLANPCPSGTTQVVPGVCLAMKWGSYGSGDGQFYNPRGIDVDSSGNVFVADGFNDRIQKFQLANPCPSGTTQVVSGVCFATKWGSHGRGNGQFLLPDGVAVDSSGNVFVTDVFNHRIQKFQLANPCPSGTTQVVPGVCLAMKWGSYGTGTGQLKEPRGVAVDSSGNVFVADTDNARIQVFRDDNPPSCTNAHSSESSLWPPNHKMKNITIHGVTDPNNDPITITITGIHQDEPTQGLGTGDESPDGTGVGTNTANVRVERSGTADGRVYHISFTADDGKEGKCNGEVIVPVPHDQAQNAIDSGAIYDSTIG